MKRYRQKYGAGQNKEIVDYGRIIGKYYDTETGKYYDTTRATIHYDSIGEYAAAVNEVEILEIGTDDSVGIYDDSIEICLLNIPKRIMPEDGTILWQKSN